MPVAPIQNNNSKAKALEAMLKSLDNLPEDLKKEVLKNLIKAGLNEKKHPTLENIQSICNVITLLAENSK